MFGLTKVYTLKSPQNPTSTNFLCIFLLLFCLALCFPICESFHNTGQVCTHPHVLVINCLFYLPGVHDWQWSLIKHNTNFTMP